uniref:Uncharacterized protein n=1 Tax=Pinguiococcus pyrenoidosus TaxID=172671 RepID=A0A7R9UDG6_9STRA|mmetsp:Transcript_6572/g.25387  ORF Transcript_6572/g.25387 Transcript_6572/m.25387 type:complete len:310 (+) Transcript_6572:149-1078(+)
MKLLQSLLFGALASWAAAQGEWRGTVYCEIWIIEPAETRGIVSLLVILAGTPEVQCVEERYEEITDEEIYATFPNATQLFRNGPRESIYSDFDHPESEPLDVYEFNTLEFRAVANTKVPEVALNALTNGVSAYLPTPINRVFVATWDGGATQYRLIDSEHHVTWQMQSLSKLDDFAPPDPGFETLEELEPLITPTLPDNLKYEVLKDVPAITIPAGPTTIMQDVFFNTYIVIEDGTPECRCQAFEPEQWGSRLDEGSIDFACEQIPQGVPSPEGGKLGDGRLCIPFLARAVCQDGFQACRVRSKLRPDE